MTFRQLCATEILSSVKRRGEAYEASGSVHNLTVDQCGATALVDGSGVTYTVDISFAFRTVGAIGATCNCPYYDKGDFCKHIWAVLVALDKCCEVRMIRGRRVDLIHGFQLDEKGQPDEDLLSDRRNRGCSFEVINREGAPLGVPRPAGNWNLLLHQIARNAEESDDDHSSSSSQRKVHPKLEVWYVLNVAASQLKGRLTIDLFQRHLRKDGTWSKPKRVSFGRDEISSIPREDDRWLAAVMLGNEVTDRKFDDDGNGLYDPYALDHGFNRCYVTPGMYEVLLPRMASTGRFVWLLDDTLPLDEGQSIAWDGGPPWNSELRMETDEAQQQWRLTGDLTRSDQQRPLQQAILLVPNEFVLFRDGLARCECGGDGPWIQLLAQNGPMIIPFHDRANWLSRLLLLPRWPSIKLPASLQVEQVTVDPTPRLEIQSPNRGFFGRQDELYGKIQFIYGEQRFTRRDKQGGHFDEASNRFLQRNPQREQMLLGRLYELGCERAGRYYLAEDTDVTLSQKIMPALVRTLVGEGWIIETQGVRMRRAGEFKLDVTTGVDWFELNGQVDFDGVQVAIPTLLAALRNHETFVRLDDGSQGILPEEWLKKYGKLARLADADGDVLKFSVSQALLLDALLAEQEHVQVDQAFADYRERLRAFAGVQPAEAPHSFCGELRNYQKDGLGWLHFLREFKFGGCLADDMGLGKTVQVLALLESRRTQTMDNGQTRQPSIVVVPKSLVFNWIDEAHKFSPELRVLNHTGIDRGDRFQATDSYDVLVTTYGTLRRDIAKLKEIRFDYAVLDEAQAIKNAGSLAAKSCRLVQSNHRLAMTGTPVENHLGELWSLFDFLNPGILGRSTAFASLARNGREQDPQMLPLLSRALRPFLLRRTKQQVLHELPEKTEQTLYCELSAKERKAYNELRDYFRLQLTETVKKKGLANSKIHVLEALLRLRQAACHPGLLDAKKTDEVSAKLETLLEHLGEIIDEGHKALVFSQFTSLLAIVRKHLDKRGLVYEYLDGKTRNRGERVNRFQTDAACPLFLISLKAGGHGLNLTAADYVFILDPWWNPAVEAQAVDRVHRIGQTRRVFAYRLIAQQTVEDKILELQKIKRDLADAIVSANSSLIRNLTSEDLEMLLS